MSSNIHDQPEVVENNVFTVWNSQIPSEKGVYWYEVDPWELWWLSENRENFSKWKEVSVKDLETIVDKSEKIQEDTFVYLPLVDLLMVAATWKELPQKPAISSRLLIISESHPEISLQVKKSTDWKNITSIIQRLRQIYNDWIVNRPQS